LGKILGLLKGLGTSVIITILLILALVLGAGAGAYFFIFLGSNTADEITASDLPRVWYRVQEGDTLEGIATKFMPRGYNVQQFKKDLMALNRMETEKIVYDQLIVVYDGRGVSTSRWGNR